jgi:flagellar hook protein FlgE
MSLFGSMTTAISGLNAQARALGHISDNVANSQTVGFKRIDTSFQDLLTQSGTVGHTPGAVVARPDATNAIQGTIEQVENPLALAISGQGFFAAARPTARAADGTASFDQRQFYTRAGDFQMDRAGYLMNSTGYALSGYQVTDGVVNRNAITPIQITEFTYQPVATREISLSANLPASLASTLPAAPTDAQMAALSQTTELQVYDGLGAAQPMRLTWTPTSAAGNSWNLTLSAADGTALPATYLDATGTTQTAAGPVNVTFANGVMSAVTVNGGLDAVPPTALTFANGANPLTLNLGPLGSGQGITQYAGSDYAVRTLSQDGVPPGSYSGLSIRENGDVVVNFDNGQSRVAAHVPLITFTDPDRLQRQDGQAFTRTAEAGEPRIAENGADGAGRLVAGAIERSNVDIAAEFSKLIVAQRSYTANTRIVTATDEMLQDTINMRR